MARSDQLKRVSRVVWLALVLGVALVVGVLVYQFARQLP
jgi:hypothetical protein